MADGQRSCPFEKNASSVCFHIEFTFLDPEATSLFSALHVSPPAGDYKQCMFKALLH